MRVLVAGVGAVGSVYLAFLTRAGYKAYGLVKRGRKIDGIAVEGLWGSFYQPVKTVESVEELDEPPELVVVAVKAYDTRKLLTDLKPSLPDGTLIFIAQNGYGNYETAVELFGEGRVILSRVIFGAKRPEPGRVRVTVCADDVVMGDPSGRLDEGFLRELARLFSSAGIPTRYEPRVEAYLWDKIVYNAALNPLGALMEATYGQVVDDGDARRLVERVIDEAYEVIKAYGFDALAPDAGSYRERFFSKLVPPTRAHYPSMLEDLKRGKTEIDALNGALVTLGRKAGLELPVNETLTRLIKARERLYSSS
ncbi:MAG: 2-dehydropantoate 2-reductase [Aquificae bacterium]|nr:2-dehydropantoate 2-reductase [Aquificota bacterium]